MIKMLCQKSHSRIFGAEMPKEDHSLLFTEIASVTNIFKRAYLTDLACNKQIAIAFYQHVDLCKANRTETKAKGFNRHRDIANHTYKFRIQLLFDHLCNLRDRKRIHQVVSANAETFSRPLIFNIQSEGFYKTRVYIIRIRIVSMIVKTVNHQIAFVEKIPFFAVDSRGSLALVIAGKSRLVSDDHINIFFLCFFYQFCSKFKASCNFFNFFFGVSRYKSVAGLLPYFKRVFE